MEKKNLKIRIKNKRYVKETFIIGFGCDYCIKSQSFTCPLCIKARSLIGYLGILVPERYFYYGEENNKSSSKE